MVEYRVERIEVSLRLAGLDVDDLAGVGALNGVRTEVADHTNPVENPLDIARQPSRGDIVDLAIKGPALSAAFVY